MKNSRLPYMVLGALVLIALIVRLANPPAPLPPGPIGRIPTWRSMAKLGDMGPWMVNPAGSMWAGAWNFKAKSGKLRSAVWAIDFEKKTAAQTLLKDGLHVSSLVWADDKTIRVMAVNKDVPAEASKSELIYIDAATGSEKKMVKTRVPMARILVWPAGSKTFAAQLAGPGDKARFSVLDEGTVTPSSASIAYGEIASEIPSDARFGREAAMSADEKLFIFSAIEDEIGNKKAFYLASQAGGPVKRLFGSEDVPGRLEGIWVSAKGVLLAVSDREKFHALVFDSSKNMFVPARNLDVAKNWPDAPKEMMFASYNGGYRLDLASGKVKRLFDLTKFSRADDRWRREAQDGRLYPRKDGGYTSVSFAADAIDIRVITAKGRGGPGLLPRS